MFPALAALCLALLPQQSGVSVDRALNSIGDFERRAGWQLAFDGRSLAGWADEHGASGKWRVNNGALEHPGGGNEVLWWAGVYSDFEIELEFDEQVFAAGPRLSLRVEAHGSEPTALTALLGGAVAPLAPIVGDARLRGVGPLVLRELGPGRWKLGLQGGGPVRRIQNVVLRDLSRLPGARVDLLAGGLAGWKQLGDARWTVAGREILGEVGGGSQSFLATERRFGDFVLEVDVLAEGPGNSGIQVRSREREDGRLVGYQLEIDPSERAWSGGLYDEARRGWLDDSQDNPAGRSAFRAGAWNRYRVECVGPRIRAWVNGIPTADWLDPLDLEGVIGLQVHAGKDTRVRWRDPVVHDLGASAWAAVADPGLAELADSTLAYGDCALRLTVRRGDPDTWIELRRRDWDCAMLESHPPPAPLGPGVVPRASEPSWPIVNLVELLAAPGIEARDEHEVALIVVGERVAAFVDGGCVVRGRIPSMPAVGPIRVASQSAEAGRELAQRIELIGRPVADSRAR